MPAIWLAALLAVLLLAALVPEGARAEGAQQELRAAEAAAIELSGVEGRNVSEGEADELLLGTPPPADLVTGRLEVMLDPAFWTQIVANLLVSQTVVLPKPVDLVKIEAALPTARVANGNRRWRLERRELDLGSVTYEWQGREKTVEELVVSTEADGVAFLHGGRLATDIYANGWSHEIRHQPWSVTKSFVSALVGIALDEGRVRSLSDRIERYIPELAGTAWEGTTIRNLLAMESGVHWDEGTPVLVVNTQVEQWVQMVLDHLTAGALGQTRNEFLASLPRVAPQGTEFSYNSGNTQVLAWMLELAYGLPFNEIVSRKLWRPMGMATDAMVMTDRVGDAIASQGLYSRIYDLARFGELFRRGGRTPDGRQVVPAGWVRRSTRMTPNSEGEYAFQWWRGATEHGYEASGFQGQKVTVAPGSCLTGVRLGHTLGGDLTPGGDDPLDPASYGFEVEMGGAEWAAAYRAVAEHVGACPTRLALRLPRAQRASLPRALRSGRLVARMGVARQIANVRLLATARAGRSGQVRVARFNDVLAPGGHRLALELTRRGRKLIERRPRAGLRLVARARSADGQRDRATARLRLTR